MPRWESLKKAIKKLGQRFAAIPKRRSMLGVLALAYGSAVAMNYFTAPLVVRLHGYNYMDRSIFNYTVNGSMGANVFRWSPGGGGKTTCCTEIKGDTVHIEWAISGTLEEVMADIPSKTYAREVALPPQPDKTPTFLEVHFLSNDNVVLRWNTWIGEPIAPIHVDPEREKAEQLAHRRRQEIVDRAQEELDRELAARAKK